jgi:hypothetical protein
LHKLLSAGKVKINFDGKETFSEILKEMGFQLKSARPQDLPPWSATILLRT